MKVLLPLILFIHIAFAESDSSWYVIIPEVLLQNDSSTLRKLKEKLPDSLFFEDWHNCSDMASRDFFTPVDSLQGICFAEPEALYGDSLPEPFYRLWFAVTDKSLAEKICKEYGGTFQKDSEGYGPGLMGDYLVDFPRFFSDTLTARITYNEIMEQFALKDRGVAFMTSGIYLVLGSCLSQEGAALLEKTLSEILDVKILQLSYQHIDI